MAYLGVPILQDVSITFYHYSGIVRGGRFVLVCFSSLFCKVRGQARKRWRVGERKKAFLSTPPPPPPYPPPIVFSQFDVGSEFAWLVPVLIETQTKNSRPKKTSSQAIT